MKGWRDGGREGGRDGQTYLDQFAELVIGLEPRQEPAKLVVVGGVGQFSRVQQDVFHAGHQRVQELGERMRKRERRGRRELKVHVTERGDET